MRTANTKSKKAGANQQKTGDQNQQKAGGQQQNTAGQGQQQQQTGQQANDLYFSMVNEMLCAERQITEALPKMVELATSQELKSTLNAHLQETQEQVQRLTQIIQKLSKQEQKSDCKSMKALLQEGPQMVQKMPEGNLRDLAIIAACRKVEYVEMSSYQSLMTVADMLQLDDHLDLLGKTLDEEEIAARKLGRAAYMGGNENEMGMPNSMQAWPPFGAEDEKENVSMRSNERERDSQGRFMSDDDDRSYGRSSYGRGGSDRGERGGGRGGERGWYGDPQGHSEAAREGWRHREDEGRGGRGGYDYDDDRGGRSNYGRGGGNDRGHGGWFGDPEGHSEAAREGWRSREGGYGGGNRGGRDYDDDDRGRSSSYGRGRGGDGEGRGWYGDPQGHSEAAREGWRHREGGYGGGSRGGRDYDDDDRGRSSNYGRGGDRGHGGWFGDPEGHSEASREGWRHREGYGRGGRD